jgi:hypothetical protein
MLQITHDAAEFIRTAREQAGVSDQAFLRIDRGSETSDGSALRLGFVDVMADGDEVGESQGIAVCAPARLADALDDKVLDVQQTSDRVGLVLRAA